MTRTWELVKKAKNHARENPNFLKMFIFFEATIEPDHWHSIQSPIHEECHRSYKKMCENYGDDAMDYQEFEFWFMRFSSGDFDMDYDRRLAPKNRSFTDLPVHIFEMITKGFCLFDRLILREVSEALRSVIDASLPIPSKIKIEVSGSSWTVTFDDEIIKFSQNMMSGVDMPTRSLWTHLLSIFRNPNLRLKFLRLDYSRLDWTTTRSPEKFNKMLQIAQNRKIHVESLEITSDFESMSLNSLIPLQYLDTGILQKLHVSCRAKVTDIKQILEKIVGSERFQLNPMIECEGTIYVPRDLRFILKPSEVTFHLRWLAPLHLAKMIKDLTQSTVLEKFHFHASDVDDFPFETLLAKHFKRPDFFKVKDIPANIRFQKIQENQFWRIEINRRLITVKKVDHFY